MRLAKYKLAACCAILPLIFAISPHAYGQPSEPFDFQFAMGVMAFRAGDYAGAKDSFMLALQERPDDLETRYSLGAAFNRLQDYEEAEKQFRRVLTLDPFFQKAYFALGIAHYHLGKYDEALLQFNRAELFELTDPVISYYKGLSYTQLQQHEEARQAFQRMADTEKEPDDAVMSYYRGLAYEKLQRHEEARQTFQRVIDIGEPPDVLGLAQDHLTRSAGSKRWALSLTASPQYDTNVIVQAPGGVLPEGISRQQDYRTTLLGQGEFRFIQTPDLTIGSSYTFQQSFHLELDEFDVQSHTPTVFATYRMSNVQVGVYYNFDYVTVGRDDYLAGHSIRPVVVVQEPAGMFSKVEYRYQSKRFKDSDQFSINSDRDGLNHEASLTQYFFSGNARMGYRFDADLTSGKSWDYQGHSFFTGLTYSPMDSLHLDGAFDYYIQDYKNPNEFSPVLARRRDDILTATLGIVVDISPRYDIGAQYVYNRNQSNVPIFDYNRSIFALTFTGKF